jgi:tripeptidyl-peptidase-1
VGGELGWWYGTSLAAPIWGSVITLLNEERTVVGKEPVGFVNPVLYVNPWALSNVKNESNPGYESRGSVLFLDRNRLLRIMSN